MSGPASFNYMALSPEEIESMRVNIDPGEASCHALEEFTASGGVEGETTVAFALGTFTQS